MYSLAFILLVTGKGVAERENEMSKMTRSDCENIMEIIDRVKELRLTTDRFGMMMDLEFCNDDIPLDFEKLRSFGDADFTHDIIGIYRNFNRETKKLDNCFLPRCAKETN